MQWCSAEQACQPQLTVEKWERSLHSHSSGRETLMQEGSHQSVSTSDLKGKEIGEGY